MILMKQNATFLIMSLMMSACAEAPAYRLENGELFPDGNPIGQPYAPGQTDIRVVRVSSVQEADSIFATLCRNGKYEHIFTFYPPEGRKMQCYRTDASNGEILYTHDVPKGTYEVSIIHIRDSAINARGIREVHFVKTIRRKRK